MRDVSDYWRAENNMTDFLEGVPVELHEQAIRKRLRLLEWIGVLCGSWIAALIFGITWIEIGIHNYVLLVVFILMTLVATYFYFRTKALLKK